MEIAERMRHWQAAIKQSNNGKDTPLSDDCAKAAAEIDRLREALRLAEEQDRNADV